MKAAVFTGEQALVVREVDKPKPTESQVLVKVVACGVCHTDAGYIAGTPTYKKPPIILGHEASGIVEEVGSKVHHLKQGNRVLIPPVLTCGACEYCLDGRETLCRNQQMLGNHIDGAFAEYIAVEAKDIVMVPEGLPLADIAIVSDAIATPYHAVVERAQVRPGDKVVVIGCGGVGINTVQFAAFAGAIVIATDVMESKLELAKQLGATYVINAGKEDVKQKVKEIFGYADIVFEVIGNPKTQEQGFNLLGRGGKLVTVGYSPKKWDGFNSGKVMYWELDVMGSLGCPPKSFPRVLHLLKTGRIKIDPLITHRYTLDTINDAFEQLHKGDGVRIIIDIATE